MFENPRRGRQAGNGTTNAPKILDLKSPSEQIFSRKLPLGTPETRSARAFMLISVGRGIGKVSCWNGRVLFGPIHRLIQTEGLFKATC